MLQLVFVESAKQARANSKMKTTFKRSSCSDYIKLKRFIVDENDILRELLQM